MSDDNDEPAPSTASLRRSFGRRRAGIGWLVALALIAAGAALWWWKTRPAEGPAATATGARRFGPASRAQPVSVQAVRRQDVHVSVDAIGTITAYNTAVVRPQVSGVLQSIAFKEGQQVRAGQLLAQIDPRAFAAAVEQAEGTLARDRAQLDNAKVDLKRYQELLAKDAVPSQQVDTQRALVHQLEGTVAADKGALDNARLQLSYTRITAPIAGRAGLKQADLGNVVSPGDANGIVTITQTRPIALVFAVPAAHLPRIAAQLQRHAPLPVQAFDRPGSVRLAAGRIETIDNAIDPSTDTIRVKAVFPNDDGALFPNQAVSVKLQLDTLAGALVVPPAAVLRGAQGFYVWVVNPDDTVSAKPIQPGPTDGDAMAVSGAIEPGERVVIDGVDRLRDGAPVQVISAEARQRIGAPPGRSPKSASAPVVGGSPPARDAATPPLHAASPALAGAASAPASGLAERPAWIDRVPPEVARKLLAMTPDERRAWFQQRRAASEAAGSGTTH
jgi:multidrug efflux system membrane fusion protein